MELAEAATEPDEALATLARSGDRAAFGALVRRHERRAVAVAIGLLGSRGEAEEAAQEAFVRAFERLDTMRDAVRFRAWFTGILFRICQEARRSRRARPSSPLPPPVTADGDASRAVEEALGLEEEFRDVLILVYLQGLTFADAAATLGITESNAKVRAHRARRMLRERLRSKGVSR
jgi:RNA polymerase sigma-70 factor (ECF subfamily)